MDSNWLASSQVFGSEIKLANSSGSFFSTAWARRVELDLLRKLEIVLNRRFFASMSLIRGRMVRERGKTIFCKSDWPFRKEMEKLNRTVATATCCLGLGLSLGSESWVAQFSRNSTLSWASFSPAGWATMLVTTLSAVSRVSSGAWVLKQERRMLSTKSCENGPEQIATLTALLRRLKRRRSKTGNSLSGKWQKRGE